ncbi:MAG TPA: ABC transporter permease [Longimicrobiales bacterium]|nr:ABC transporter permease [Longimicrobiales bacterium]
MTAPSLFHGLGRDARVAARRLLRQRSFTFIAVSTLALGIGANTAVFSLVRGVLLRPLPYAAPERLAIIWDPDAEPTEETWLSERELVEYRAALNGLENLAGYTDGEFSVTGDGEPEQVLGASVTANTFTALGVAPLHGRVFTEAEDAADADVVVIGYEVWQRRFGGGDAIGRTLVVNGTARTVTGVMPVGFQLPTDYRADVPTSLWVPASIDAVANPSFGNRSYHLFARLAPGVDAAAVSDQIRRLPALWLADGRLARPDEGMARRAMMPLDALLLREVRPALLLLIGAVVLVLLMACVNVMHLLLAQGDARRREIATAAALGANRWRIVRPLVIENGLLAFAGAAAGGAIAWAVLRAGVGLAPVSILRMRDIGLDLTVLAFAIALAVVATLLAGLAPALQLARVDVASSLAGARGDTASVRRTVRHGLIIVQTALSLVVIIGGGLLTRSLLELRRTDLGFEPQDVLSLRISLPASDYADPERVAAFYGQLIDRVEALPAVESVAATRLLPLTGTIGNWTITVEGREFAPGNEPSGDWQIVTAGYFETMRMRLSAGRLPTRADDRADAPLVAVVNRTMAARYWDGNAVGRRFHLGTLDQPWVEIVGVTEDVRHNGVIEEARAEMYLMHSQWSRVTNGNAPRRAMTVVVRGTGDMDAVVPAVRAAVRELDPNLPIAHVRTLDDVVATALVQPRFLSLLLGSFAILALILAGVGLYGIMSFMAARRTRELGIRVALGATPGGNLRVLVGEATRLAGMGVVAGAVGALWLGTIIASQLHGISATDPLTFGVAVLLVMGVAIGAAAVPAWRAARTSPLSALSAD